MAKIILNVDLNTTELNKKAQGIQEQLRNIATASSKALTPQNATSQIDTLRKQYANLAQQVKNFQRSFSSSEWDAVSKSVNTAYSSIKNISEEFAKSQKLTEEQKRSIASLREEYKKLAADVAQTRTDATRLESSEAISPKTESSLIRLSGQWATLANNIKSVEKYYPKGTFDSINSEIEQQRANLSALLTEYNNLGGKVSAEFQEKMNASTTALAKQKTAFEETKGSATNFHGTLVDIVSGFGKFQLAAMLVMQPLNAIRNAIASINETLVETEKVVVSLQRVLDESVTSGKISNALYDIAQRLGQTFDNVQEIAQNFAKAGLSWQETLDATEAAVLALNVAELTAAESSEGLIAIMQQFNYEASELVGVIDVLNKAADKSAVDTPALLVALQKTGSYAAAANLSLEETVALVSALSEATAASGQNIGNALKSLLAYTTKDSSLSMFASLSGDMSEVVARYQLGAASILDVWEQLSTEMQSLDKEQADLLSEWTESSGLDDELSQSLGDIYDKLTGIYDTAGTYRKNYFIALLNNFEEVREVMGEITDAQGYTQAEQEKYMNTYEAKLNALQAKWEEIANDEQGILAIKKALVDIASALLEIIDFFGGITPLIMAAASAIALFAGNKIIAGIKTLTTAFKSLFTSISTGAMTANAALGIIGLVATAITMLVGVIQSFVEAAEEARQQTIDAWRSSEETGEELLSLAEKYEKLTAADEEFYEIEQKIVALLDNDKQKALESLTQGTVEYTNAVQTMTEAEKRHYETQKAAALEAVKEQIRKINVGGRVNWLMTGTRSEVEAMTSVADDVGMDYNKASATGFRFDRMSHKNDFNTQLQNYETLLKWQDAIEKAREKYLLEGDDAKANAALQIWQKLETEIAYAKEYFDAYYDLIDDSEDETEEIVDETEKWRNSLEDVTDKYETLLSKIKEIRDTEEERTNLEEKKKALLEAQQQLLNAQNERTKAVYNAETGMFEFHADQQAIEDAKDAVEKAEEDLADVGWDKVENLLEQDVVTNEEMLEAINSIAEYLPDWAQAVKDLIKEGTGVDLDLPVYDSGGILRGLGGIKATQGNEIVLPPNISERILQPTSNKQFSDFVSALGLMFGSSRGVINSPSVQGRMGNIDNHDGRTYVINGVPIGREYADNYTISEICDMMGLVK